MVKNRIGYKKILYYMTQHGDGAILIFDKCLYLQGNNCKTAFSLHVVESASDVVIFYSFLKFYFFLSHHHFGHHFRFPFG